MGPLGKMGFGVLACVLLVVSGCTSTPPSTPSRASAVSPPTTSEAGSAPETSTDPPSDLSGAAQEEVPQASAAFPQTRTAPRQLVNDANTITFLNAVIRHADQEVWVPYFKVIGLKEPMVDVKMVGSQETPTFNSVCDLNDDKVKGNDTVFPTTPNAWYCPSDSAATWGGAVILPVTTFTTMWNGVVLDKLSVRGGDFAAAVVAAHEFGHHVADELAIQLATPQLIGSKSPELIADCFAGIWAAGAYSGGYLEDGDFQEGVSAIVAIGVNGSKTHGTPAERKQAFMAGWNANHLPYACLKAYWPTMATKMLTL